MACLDTCVIVDLRGRDPARKSRAADKIGRLRQRGERIVVSRFTWAELYVGVSRAPDAAAEEAGIRRVMEAVPVLEFDEDACRIFGFLTARLAKQGRPAGDMDVLIAATALSSRHSIVTRDLEHFGRIPGLVVETY